MNVLFVAYNAASDPIMDSQAFSYMRVLSKKGIRYSLFTLEPKEALKDSKDYIAKLDFSIKWRHLVYHRKFRLLSRCYDMVCGMFVVMWILKRHKISIVHARGPIPAMIAFLPVKIFGIKLFFDTRGFLADKYVCGELLKKGSIAYKLLKWCEDILIRKSDYLTVETRRHAEELLKTYPWLSAKMGIIPCCVDTQKFNYQLFPERRDSVFDLVFLGKVRTWYLLEDMFDFFAVMSKDITNARFTFITESDPRHIYSAAEKKGIEEAMVRVMKAQRSDVPALLSAANAGIFFMNTYQQYNFSPIKFGEFLACGLPVIINFGFGDCDEIALKEDVGVAINEFSEKEYERQILKLKGLLSEGDALRQRCREIAERYFSLDMGVNRYFDIYSLLNK